MSENLENLIMAYLMEYKLCGLELRVSKLFEKCSGTEKRLNALEKRAAAWRERNDENSKPQDAF